MKNVAIIPARFNSKRFHGKLLENFLTKPILGHVIQRTQKMGFIDKIIVSTEDSKIEDYVNKNYPNIEVIYHNGCRCGTERVYRYYKQNQEYNWYFSIPSDEPCITPKELNRVWPKVPKKTDEIISFYTQFFCQKDLESHLSCKIVTNMTNYMLYNSRAIVPINKSGKQLSLKDYKKHVGIFAFSNQLLEKEGKNLWGKWNSTSADVTGLEQNRFLDYGLKVRVYKINHIGFGIDVSDQISILEHRIHAQGKDDGYRDIIV